MTQRVARETNNEASIIVHPRGNSGQARAETHCDKGKGIMREPDASQRERGHHTRPPDSRCAEIDEDGVDQNLGGSSMAAMEVVEETPGICEIGANMALD